MRPSPLNLFSTLEINRCDKVIRIEILIETKFMNILKRNLRCCTPCITLLQMSTIIPSKAKTTTYRQRLALLRMRSWSVRREYTSPCMSTVHLFIQTTKYTTLCEITIIALNPIHIAIKLLGISSSFLLKQQQACCPPSLLGQLLRPRRHALAKRLNQSFFQFSFYLC